MKVLSVLMVIMVMLVLVAACGAQEIVKELSGTTYPKFESPVVSVGFFPLYFSGQIASNKNVVSRLHIKATTDATFNIWTCKWSPLDATPTYAWSRICPSFGFTAADTIITLAEGDSDYYYFDKGVPKGIYLRSGTLLVKGE